MEALPRLRFATVFDKLDCISARQVFFFFVSDQKNCTIGSEVYQVKIDGFYLLNCTIACVCVRACMCGWVGVGVGVGVCGVCGCGSVWGVWVCVHAHINAYTCMRACMHACTHLHVHTPVWTVTVHSPPWFSPMRQRFPLTILSTFKQIGLNLLPSLPIGSRLEMHFELMISSLNAFIC